MEAVKNKQVTDPEVTRRKFEREIAEFKKIELDLSKKGIICLKSEFPIIQFSFAAHQLKPAPTVFAVSFSREPVTMKEMTIQFYLEKSINVQLPGMSPIQQIQRQEILVGAPNDHPFLCIPSVREYHTHPKHTGDFWLLHRNKGEGTLGFILDQLYNNSIPFVKGYNVSFSITINQQ